MGKVKNQVVISGGGPSGLAAALLLADLGWQDIVVVERRSAPGDFEKNKAFNYQIDPRGQKLLKRLGVEAMLDEYGVANRGFTLTTIRPDGEDIVSSPPIIDPERQTSYWTTRRNFLTMMYRAIEERGGPHIRLLYGHAFKSLSPGPEGRPRVAIEDLSSGDVHVCQPELVLACDGLFSQVRQCLQNWPDMESGRYDMVQYPSASTGLTYKVLNLPACFNVNGKIGTVDDHRMTYSILSRHKDRRDAMSLFAFPVTDPRHPRSVNIIREADHNLWSITDSEDLMAYLQDAFPQLNVSELVSRQEAEDFANLEPGKFPAPQHAKSIHAALGEGEEAMDCLLIGDAAHAFPPDLGLGVNSALEDLFVLDQVFARNGDDISRGCIEFERTRLPQHASLVRLVQTVAPYQYNHRPWRLKFWILVFMIQFWLNRLMPWLIDKPAFVLVQNPALDFEEIERRQQKSRRTLRLLGLGILGLLAFAAIAVAI